jgi:methyl-accepting chemotaxis protein
MILFNVRIGTRLVLGFLILNLMILGLNAYTYMTTHNIQTLLSGTVRAASDQASLLEFQLNAFRMRAHAWSAYGTGEAKRWEQAEKSAKEALDVLADLQKSTLDPNRQKKLQEIREYWDAYNEAMKGILALGGNNPNLLTQQAEAPFKAAATARKKFDDNSEDIKKLYNEALISRSALASKTVDESNHLSLIIGAISLLLSLILATTLSRSISRPLKAITVAMAQLSQGNLDVEIPASGRKDEIGEMAEALKIFKDNAKQIDGLKKAQEEAATKAAVERKAAMNKMANEFESNILSIVKAVSASAAELQAAAQNLTIAA